MNYWDKKLLIEQLDDKMAPFRSYANKPIQGAWIKSIRLALGMTSDQLAKRVGMQQSRIIRIEKDELKGNLTFNTVRKVAEGFDMKFVYGFASDKSIKEILYDRAKEIALETLNRVDHSMYLEMQQLSGNEKEKAMEELVERTLQEEKNIWE